MNSPPRIAGPDVGPLDFLHALAIHKQHWLNTMQHPEQYPEMRSVFAHFERTWNNIKTALDQNDTTSLKTMQSYLSPWPPVIMLALDPQSSNIVHAAWQILLEFHTCARLGLDQPAIVQSKKWNSWKMSLHEQQWSSCFDFPLSTSIPGVLRGGNTVSVVTTQPFSFVRGQRLLQKIQSDNKDAEAFRFQSPSCCSFDTSYRLAAQDLFGAHSDVEINKLAFWSVVGIQKESDLASSLAWRPRYYGGSTGAQSWAVKDAAVSSGQSAAQSRASMMRWMTALSDSLEEQLHRRNDIAWNSAHNDFLQAYIRSWHAVTKIGIAHKRTAAQVNELLGYTTSIHKQLEHAKNINAPDLSRVLQWTNMRLQQSLGSRAPALLLE